MVRMAFSKGYRLSRARLVASVSLLILLGGPLAIAQSAPNALPEAPQPQNQRQSDSDAVVGLRDLPKNLLEDQKAIWTSPLKIRASNAAIPIVLVVGTAAAITTDHEVMSQTVSQTPTFNSDALTASNGMLGVLGAAPVLFYACGKAKNDDHATETGILAAEAASSFPRQSRSSRGARGQTSTKRRAGFFSRASALIRRSRLITHLLPGLLRQQLRPSITDPLR